MIEITLLRHAKVAGPAALYGKTNIEAQIIENQKIVNSFSNSEQAFDLVVSSPLQRCYLVAQQLSTELNVQLVCNEYFEEMNFGLIDGIPFEQLVGDNASHVNAEKYWSLLEMFWQNPAQTTLPLAESLAEFNQRVTKGWQLLIKQLIAQSAKEDNCGKKILLVCHGGVIRMILAHVLALDWQNANWYQGLSIDYASTSKITLTVLANHDEKSSLRVNYIGLPLSSMTGKD
ncbi:MAG: histidine phosphatase family protein [Colwellia sp.]|nr:histidine phosphatase family protein [Colwellia sp.]